jgi:hypothetical protein
MRPEGVAQEAQGNMDRLVQRVPLERIASLHGFAINTKTMFVYLFV